jgi:cyclophilin family peptidyl-prolyl cis-trans isomerase
MAQKSYSAPPEMQIETNRKYKATIRTNKGDIVLELNPAEAPQTVNNFVVLARDGFYDNVTFHRVVPHFVIQGGDPTGTGAGGPGYKFKDEPVVRPYKAGTLAMANAGPNTNGSQFFIVLEDQPTLPPSYTIFGDTVSGMDVVRNIRMGDQIQTIVVE